MMKVVIIPGSLRPNSVGIKLIPYVEAALLSQKNVETEVVKVEDITLPLFDAAASPAAGLDIHHQSVKSWSRMIRAADRIVLLTPEYNKSISPVQKNYIDWLYAEWHDKKIACINYNHYDKKSAVESLKEILGSVKAEVVDPITYLRFGQEIDEAGTMLDESAVQLKINATITALIK